LGAGDGAGEEVAGVGVLGDGGVGEVFEDVVAVARVIAVSALGDGVADEGESAVVAGESVVREEGGGEAASDEEFGGFVEVESVGDGGLEVEVREEGDVWGFAGDGGVAGADDVAGGAGGGDACDDGVEV
jgi:hypothetical protein